MVSFTEAQVLAWITPWLWAFFRVAGIFTTAPVLSQKSIPRRVRLALAILIVICAQPSLPPMPDIAINSPQAVMVIIQQVLIGLTMGFSARVVFAAIEFAGEIIGLQMGLSFASFFDPMMGGQANGASRFLGTTALWLFVVMNGHLLLTGAVLQSFHAFPVSPEPLAISVDTMHDLEDNLMLFFTGFSRSASSILKDQNTRTKQSDGDMLNNLHYVKDLGLRSKQALEQGDPLAFGRLMHK